MRHSSQTRYKSSFIALTILCVAASCPIASYAQSNQIQRLPQARQQRVYSLLEQIQNAFAEDDTAALNACNAAIAEFPHIGQFYLRRGDAYASRGDDAKALTDYNHARSCDQMLASDAVHFSSNIYCRQKKFDLALKELDSLPVNTFGVRGAPESRVSIYLQMGDRATAESLFRSYRDHLISMGTWSEEILTRFPAFANLKFEEPKPNTTHSADAFALLKKLSLFEHMPEKRELESVLGVKLATGKSSTGKPGLVGEGNFFKVFVDLRTKQVYFTVVNGVSFLDAKDILKVLKYQGSESAETFFYVIRNTPSDPKMITLDFSGPYKGLRAATYSWNVAPDTGADFLAGVQNAQDSPMLMQMLKKLDAGPMPINKAKFESITKCKLKQSAGIFPSFFSGMTETETVWRAGNGFGSQKSWWVNYTPDGAYLNDSRLLVAPGAENVTKQGLEELFGPGVELQSGESSKNWRLDSRSVSYKRPYGSITATFSNSVNKEQPATHLVFWWRGQSPYSTLEEFETHRTSAVLCDEAVRATGKNEFKRAVYLLRLAYYRGGFSQQSGIEKYELWKRIRAAYVDVYEKKGDSARAVYLRNVTCQKMNGVLIELESNGSDFPTLKESEAIPWRISHMPEGLAYTLQGDKEHTEVFRSSPNFKRCVELFGPMNDGVDLFVKSVPADLCDSEYFGPGYYD
jgi:hypothetical protein